MARPNVLFVFADQMRAQATGYAGDANAHTPVLDRLAAASLNVTHAVSGHPVCCPYRAALMTGQYPLRHGVFVNDVPLETHAAPLAKVFADAGYDTAYIGKWHLYGSPDGNYNRRRAFVPPEARLGFSSWKGFECNHDYNHSPYFEGDSREVKYWEGYDALAQTRDACRTIRDSARGKRPFFLMLSWAPPHDPYHTAPEAWRELLQKREIGLRPNVPEHRAAQAREALRGYYAHIAALDDCLGMLLDAVDGAGIAEDTLLVFTSDHGDMHGSQDLVAKHCPWDESIRVPFLLRYPRLAGRMARQLSIPLDAPDLMPTLLGLCAIPIPATVQGRDFSPEIRGERTPDPDAAALLCVPTSYGALRSQGLPAYRGLRTARYTYVRSVEGPWLLYDNDADPYQLDNLCGQPSAAPVQARLEALLQDRLRATDDPFFSGAEHLARAGLGHYREATCPIHANASRWSRGSV
ncbi:MAG: sulfatase [Lentisphaeria bacterium]|nr:sulfatase [Lentisphaeria bacterium]